MELNEDQIAFIRNDIRLRGIVISDIEESLVDHICCILEESEDMDFHEAYRKSIEAFGMNGIEWVQKESIKQINNRTIIMKKTMYAFGYLATILITTGLLFKIQHWPGASILLVLGIALLNFGFLPILFFSRFRSAVD